MPPEATSFFYFRLSDKSLLLYANSRGRYEKYFDYNPQTLGPLWFLSGQETLV